MKEKIPRLLFTEEPYFDESFIGYILRLAELNEIPDIRWIFKLIRPVKYPRYDYPYSFDFRVETLTLATITGVDEAKLKNLLYFNYFTVKQYANCDIDVFDQQIRPYLICRQNPKICPPCLIERNYCQKVWEIAFVTACPVHKCLLLDYCPTCQERLRWSRPRVSFCTCQFDFRETKVNFLEDKELLLSNYFHLIFGLSSGKPEFKFDYPFRTLSRDDLLKLLLFLLAYYYNWYDYRGDKLPQYLDNDLIHKFLVSSIRVFDYWENYYAFIEDWSNQYKNHVFIDKAAYSTRFILPFAYSEYELFNYILRTYFDTKEYRFLRQGFVKFLKKLPVEDNSESYLLDYL